MSSVRVQCPVVAWAGGRIEYVADADCVSQKEANYDFDNYVSTNYRQIVGGSMPSVGQLRVPFFKKCGAAGLLFVVIPVVSCRWSAQLQLARSRGVR